MEMRLQPDNTARTAVARTASAAGTAVPFIVVSLIWGSTWLVIKDQVATVPPGWSITWRFLIASAFMVILARVRGESLRLPPGAQKLAALVGLMQFCVNYQFVYPSERYVTSGVVAVLYALLMVPNALLSALFLGTRVSGRFIGGSAVALLGIGLLLHHEIRLAPPGSAVPLGVGLAVAGITAASCANVAQAARAARLSAPVPFMAWAMIWGTGLDAAWALVTIGPPVIDPGLPYLGGLVYLAVFGSALTFPLYFRLIQDMGAGKAAYTGVATPVVAMLLSTLFEGYRWSMLAAAGSAIAILGLLIALSSRRA